MTISHDDYDKANLAYDAWMNGRFLSIMIPEPDFSEEVDPGKARVFWRNTNWGQKWDVGRNDQISPEYPVLENNTFTAKFESAWSPPLAAYATLRAEGFRINAYYFEPMMDFCGRWLDGLDEFYQFEWDESGDYDSRWDVRNIPPDIVDAFDLGSS